MIDQDLESDEIDQLIETFLERFRRGERPSIDDLCKEHPQHEAELRDLIPSLLALERAAPAQHEAEQRRLDKLPLKQMGDYRLLRLIGRGGMGTVYEAEQSSLGRRVALKVLANAVNAPRLAKRFEREARAVAHLHHSNIVPIFAVGEFEGSLYYAMQLIHGQGLDGVLSELRRLWKTWRRTQGRPELDDGPDDDTDSMHRASVQSAIIATSLVSEPSATEPRASDSIENGANGASSISTILNIGPKSGFDTAEYFRRIARIGLQSAEALEYAHSQNVLHRDVKPGNLLLDVRGAVWLTDFGLAKILDDEDLTATGDLLGTLRYLAPENFSGRATARSDVYSLGLTLYELVTLRPAFTDRHRSDLINRITSGDIARVKEANPDAPRDLDTIIHKAIEVDPKHRYPSAEALAADLRRYINDEPIRARPVHAMELLGRWARKNRTVAGLLAFNAVLLVGIAAAATYAAFAFNSVANEAVKERATAKTEAAKAEQRADLMAFRTAHDQAMAGEVERSMGTFVSLLQKTPAEDADQRRLLALNMSAWRPHLWQPLLRFPKGTTLACLNEHSAFVIQEGKIRRFDLTTLEESAVPIDVKSFGLCMSHLPERNLAMFSQFGRTVQPELRVVDLTTGKPLGEPHLPEARWLPNRFPPSAVYDGVAAFMADHPKLGPACYAFDPKTGKSLFPPIRIHPFPTVTRFAKLRDGTPAVVVLPVLDATYSGWSIRFDEGLSRWDRAYVINLKTGNRVPPPVDFHDSSLASRPDSPEGLLYFSGYESLISPRTLDASGPLFFDRYSFHSHPAILVDGRLEMVGGRDGNVRLIDAVERFSLTTWSAQGPERTVDGSAALHLFASPDGRFAWANMGSEMAVARIGLHNPNTPRGASMSIQRGKTREYYRAGFSPDGRQAWFGGVFENEGEVGRQVDVETGKVIGKPQFDFVGSTYRTGDIAPFSPDGKRLLTASRETRSRTQAVRFFQTSNGDSDGRPVMLPQFIHSYAFDPASKFVCVGLVGGIAVIDADNRSQASVIPAPGPWNRLYFSADGKHLAATARSGWGSKSGIQIFDLTTRKRTPHFIPASDFTFVRFTSPTEFVALDLPGNERIDVDVASGKAERAKLVRDAEGWFGPGAAVKAVFHPTQSKALLASTENGVVHLVDYDRGVVVGRPMTYFKPISEIQFSDDGGLILVGYEDGTVRIWDGASTEPVGPSLHHYSGVLAIKPTPDGKSFRVATAAGHVRTWPLPSAEAMDSETWSRWQANRAEKAGTKSFLRLESDPIEAAGQDVDSFLLRRLQDADEAMQLRASLYLLDRLIERQPKEWWWRLRKAAMLRRLDRADDAAKTFAEVVSMASSATAADAALAVAQEAALATNNDVASWWVERIVELKRDDPVLLTGIAWIRDRLGEFDQAGREFEEAAKRTKSLFPIEMAGENALIRGDLRVAAGYIDRLIGDDPASASRQFRAASAMLLAGDVASYKKICDAMIARASKRPPGMDVANTVAMCAALHPEGARDWNAMLTLVDRAIQEASATLPDPQRGLFLHAAKNTKAAVLVRMNRPDDAVKELKLAEQQKLFKLESADHLVLALAHQRKGDRATAAEEMKKGGQESVPGWGGLEFEILHRELKRSGVE